MTAGFTFKKDASTLTQNLDEAKIIVYEDGGGNKYTLDASGITGLTKIDDLKLSNLLKEEIKFKYHPSGGAEAEKTGLGNIIGTLFATQKVNDGKSVLAEEVAKKPVVEAIFDAEDGQNNIAETKLGTTFVKTANLETSAVAGKLFDVKFAATDTTNPNKNVAEVKLSASFAKKDGDNIEQAKFAKKILDATEKDANNKDKSILVEKLGGFLGKTGNGDKAKYDGTTDQTAKAFLVTKGLKPDSGDVATELLKDSDFKNGTKINANAQDTVFQGAVRGVMSQPVFEIPEDGGPLSWDWP
ncbi:hypothetical protein GOM44_04485 [Wolbachia endosymbiont of Atemnus politus]|uniref:hypothetical protein n=1 Tax=Wolbachia endosymbiont of Atemnus politus TaxID=2682840 RepID=UPI0015731B70|nr:hypothetical protein [Wolbachia endosymbiont of Atemnus politus]NSX83582.1 hypothetical protein [Wolbachia endosymbiont of Atemnus politus]